MQKLIILYTTIFFLNTPFSWSQNPFYYKIDQSKGLPSNSVYDVYQDTKGFMWFATNQGICKFDGKIFDIYTADFQTSKSGSNIKEDKYGRIWYSNFDGFLYYIENNKLKALNNTNTIGFVKFGIVKNYLLVLQKNNILVYSLKDLKIIKKIPFDTNKLITTHCYKNIFYIIGKEFIQIDEKLIIRKYKLQKEILEDFPASIIQNSPDGIILVSKYAKHYYIFKNSKFYKKNIVGNFNFIQNLAYDETTNWICTTQGVIKYKNHQINTQNTILKDFNISYVFKDQQHNYWFSTISDGLLLVPNINNNFIPFYKKPVTINISNNELFIGTTTDNIYKTNLKNINFQPIYDGGTNHEIYFLTADSLHQKLLFTSNSFKTLDINNLQKTESIIALKDAQKIDQTYYVFAASGECGFLKISKKTSEWDNYVQKKCVSGANLFGIFGLLKNVQGKSASYNPLNKTLYFATNSGIFAVNNRQTVEIKYNNKRLFFSKIKYYNTAIYGITTNDQFYIINNKNQVKKFNITIYTNGEKVVRFKILQNFLYLFTPYSIYEFDLFEKKSKKIIALNAEFEITDIAKNNTDIWLANSRGFLLLNDKNSNDSKYPKFVVNQIKVNNKERSLEALEHLKYDENDININFSILSYIPNQKNRLYYKINHQNWQLFDDEGRNFKLNLLPPGQYNIYFQTEYENKKSNITKIKIDIKKPIWQTFSFILFSIILLFTLLFLLYKWQIRKIIKNNQLILDKINLEKNANQSKLKAIKSQMNPHFFYNALNTLQSYILSNEKKEAIEYLSKFSNLTRTILEMTEKDWISVAEEVKTLKLYLDIEKGRFDDDFQYEIIVDPKIDDETSRIPSMLLQPFVENAIKHGLLHKVGIKVLIISFEKEAKNIKISIDDNGIGRQKSSELNQIKNKMHQSFATDALQNRINLLNQYNHQDITITITDKYNTTQQPSGTIVVLTIPISS